MFEAILEFDRNLFFEINSFHHAAIDSFMEGISNKYIWVPFYLYLFYAIIVNYKAKSIYIILTVALLVTLCDQLSVHMFKEVFMRLRPCHEPSIANEVHIVNYRCGGLYGFVSSHATNVFGLAVFVGLILNKYEKFWLVVLLIWASVVSYSRIYLGVHYPGDILGGALLGSTLALLLYWLLTFLNKKFSLQIPRI